MESGQGLTQASKQVGGGFTFRVFEYQAVAVARHLAGRARPLPPVAEQKEWEAKRIAEKKGGKDYYSIENNWQEFFELMREIAGDPLPGTTGRKLLKFDERWLEMWAGMAAPKTKAFEEARRAAEEEIARKRKEGERLGVNL